MEESGAWDQNCCARGELKDKFTVPKDQMATLGVVEISECCDGAPAKGEIGKVPMSKGTGLGAKIKGTR